MISEQKKTGTYEWAVTGVNCSIGCPNGCNYCYARRISLNRSEIKDFSEWTKRNDVKRNIQREKTKYPGTVMFPTMHDIHEGNLNVCIKVLENLLSAGNHVLITSKPRISCIKTICDHFKSRISQILFRFSIGTTSEPILQIWEPNAPDSGERIDCLKYAKDAGFSTSVSMEPALDPTCIPLDASLLLPHVTDTLWIGKMNKIQERAWVVNPEILEELENYQEDDHFFIHMTYEPLKSNPKIRWKDSYQKVITRWQSTQSK